MEKPTPTHNADTKKALTDNHHYPSGLTPALLPPEELIPQGWRLPGGVQARFSHTLDGREVAELWAEGVQVMLIRRGDGWHLLSRFREHPARETCLGKLLEALAEAGVKGIEEIAPRAPQVHPTTPTTPTTPTAPDSRG